MAAMTSTSKPELRVALYARVSTAEQQTISAQIEALEEFANRRGWKIVEKFSDEGVSGRSDSRPGLDRMMELVRQRKVDVVTVTKLDRIGRSTIHLLTLLQTFRRLGVQFISLQEGWDTTTPHGELLYTILAGFAQFEASLISSRTKEALAYIKRKNPWLLGRPHKIETKEEVERILADRKRGIPLAVIAREHRCSPALICGIVNGHAPILKKLGILTEGRNGDIASTVSGG